MKKLVSLSMAVALGASILQGCGSKTGSAEEFTASSKGFGGDVTITAKVENGKVLSYQIQSDLSLPERQSHLHL